jgi:hypothetical protein
MRTRQECLAKVAELQRKADGCSDSTRKHIYLQMAQGWKYAALLARFDKTNEGHGHSSSA